jgi:hypothetical protein
MVRGVVNQSGRFEDLGIVLPQPFSSAQFVLAALQQWQFRPALQNGHAVRVQLMLIIPSQESVLFLKAASKMSRRTVAIPIPA